MTKNLILIIVATLLIFALNRWEHSQKFYDDCNVDLVEGSVRYGNY